MDYTPKSPQTQSGMGSVSGSTGGIPTAPTSVSPNRELIRAEDRSVSSTMARNRVMVKPNFRGRKKQMGKVR